MKMKRLQPIRGAFVLSVILCVTGCIQPQDDPNVVRMVARHPDSIYETKAFSDVRCFEISRRESMVGYYWWEVYESGELIKRIHSTMVFIDPDPNTKSATVDLFAVVDIPELSYDTRLLRAFSSCCGHPQYVVAEFDEGLVRRSHQNMGRASLEFGVTYDLWTTTFDKVAAPVTRGTSQLADVSFDDWKRADVALKLRLQLQSRVDYERAKKELVREPE